jgi:hypothetical protein
MQENIDKQYKEIRERIQDMNEKLIKETEIITKNQLEILKL